MKFEDMYVGQKVRVRSWEDMVSDPSLITGELLNGTTLISSINPDEFGMFFKNEESWCGAIVTIRSLSPNVTCKGTGCVLVKDGDEDIPFLWPSWVFEQPIDAKVEIDSDVFLSCLML